MAKKTKGQVNLSAPWYTISNEIKALFGADPDVTVGDPEGSGDTGDVKVTIKVKNFAKAMAINEIIRNDINFGGVKFHVNVEVDLPTGQLYKDLINTAFEGNPIFHAVVAERDPMQQEHDFCVFENDIIQFYNDDITDYCGNKTEFPSQAAENALDVDPEYMHFCQKSLKED